jgi:hypothetical protein
MPQGGIFEAQFCRGLKQRGQQAQHGEQLMADQPQAQAIFDQPQ